MESLRSRMQKAKVDAEKAHKQEVYDYVTNTIMDAIAGREKNAIIDLGEYTLEEIKHVLDEGGVPFTVKHHAGGERGGLFHCSYDYFSIDLK